MISAGANVTLAAGVYPASGSYKSLVVENGATLVCAGDTSVSPGSGVTICAKSMTVAGSITADAQGYAAKAGPGYASTGASHAGAIGVQSYALPPMLASYVYVSDSGGLYFPTCKFVYGDYKEPVALGSGGSAGVGGGSVKLVVANDLTLDGSVTANGTGASAGGSVWISAGSFAGAGRISADAGQSGVNGASGGRIAIYHDATTFTGHVSAKGYRGSTSWGLLGTHYEPNRFPTGSAAAPADVTLTDEAFYIFGENEPMHYLNLTVTAGVRTGLAGGKVSLGDFMLSGAGTMLAFGQCYSNGAPSMQALTFDSITVEGTSNLLLPDSTNVTRYELSSLSIAAGSAVYVGRGDMTYANTASGGTSGNPHGRGTEIFCDGNATVAGTLSAQGRGFVDGKGIGYNITLGPGHGGVGQNGNAASIYGQPTRPTSLGTGAWTNGGQMYAGGGAVKLMVAGTLELSGTVTADSGYPSINTQSVGSGGSVWIQANTITGAGNVSARSSEGRRFGAAGRIAVEAVTNEFTGSVKCGVRYIADNVVAPGTVFIDKVPSMNVFGWDAGKPALLSNYAKSGVDFNLFKPTSTSNNYFVFDRTVSAWRMTGPKFAWTENNYLVATPSSTYANTVTYTVTGLVPESRYLFSQNGVVIAGGDTPLKADANGAVSVSATFEQGDNEFVFETANRGTILTFR